MMTKSASIDFKKYRTPELVDRLLGLVDISGKLKYSILMILVWIIVFELIGTWASWNGHWLYVILAWVYGLMFGTLTGVLFALADVVRRSLYDLLSVLKITLQTTKQVAADLRSISSGDMRMPSARELVDGVYCEVIIPTLEQVIVSSGLGIIGRPVLWVYRNSLGRLMRRVIKMLPDEKMEQLIGSKLDETAMETAEVLVSVSDDEGNADKTLNWLGTKVEHLGFWFKTVVVIPYYTFAILFFLLTLVPLVVYRFLTG